MEAQQVIALARRYKGHCFIGRGNTRSNHSDYVVDYWIAPTNVPSTIQKEDCREYDRGSLTIKGKTVRRFTPANVCMPTLTDDPTAGWQS